MTKSKSLGSHASLGVACNVTRKQAVLATLVVLALLTIVAQLNDTNSYDFGGAQSILSNSTPAINSFQISRTHDAVCFSWDNGSEADEWWAAHPIYEASSVDENSVCFSPFRHGAKRSFFARLHAHQYNISNCEKAHTRYMWSSGWGADLFNVILGLMFGLETNRPFQVTLAEAHNGWHYSAFKENYRNGRPPVCPTQDMYCYFLPMTPCSPAKVLETDEYHTAFEQHEKYWEFQYYPWALEYATRQQMWIRRRVFEFIRDRGPKLATPCAAMHVRRADVILHGSQSRKYFSIEEYLETLNRHGSKHKNILLLTDDANAVDEAVLLHPQYNWMYFNKTRHRGSSGGWENQVPSDDPADEVAAIISEHELAKQCDSFVYGNSGYANSILNSMRQSGQQILNFRVDEGRNIWDVGHNNSEIELSARLEEARKKLKEGDVSSQEDSKAPSQILEELAQPTNEAESFSNDINSFSCAPRKGIIVLNLLGRLGNNIFELGFASKMAKELCWGVTYRTAWQSTFLEDETKCFPNALISPTSFDEAENQKLGFKGEPPTEISPSLYDSWAGERQADGTMVSLRHIDFVAKLPNVAKVLREIRSAESKAQILELNAFFLHGDWLDDTATSIMRDELRPSDSCCKSIPSEDTVVIHILEFELEPDEPWVSVKSGYYRQLFDHYGLAGRPIWIVTQPLSLESDLLKDLRKEFSDAVVTAGEDPIDAFCILTKAKTLVLSHKSTYSQGAALIADPDVVVHYPIFDMSPFLTFGVESWKYHLVSENRNGIKEFEVPLERLTMKYEISLRDQVMQVGRGSYENGTIVLH